MPHVKATPRHRIVAELITSGVSAQEALKQAGYAPSVARTGMWQVRNNQSLQLAILEQAQKTAGFQQLTANQQESFVRNSLVSGAVTGEVNPNQVRCLELLGRDRRVNLFTPDSQTGVIVLNVQGRENDSQVIEALPEAEEI